MAHVRTQIRRAIIEACTGLPTTDDRVYPARVHPLGEAAPPTLVVFFLKEENDDNAMGGLVLRKARFSILAEVSGTADSLDDTLDQIAIEVEPALAADPTFAGVAIDSRLITSESAYNGEGSVPLGQLNMELEVQYRTTRAAPEAAV